MFDVNFFDMKSTTNDGNSTWVWNGVRNWKIFGEL